MILSAARLRAKPLGLLSSLSFAFFFSFGSSFFVASDLRFSPPFLSPPPFLSLASNSLILSSQSRFSTGSSFFVASDLRFSPPFLSPPPFLSLVSNSLILSSQSRFSTGSQVFSSSASKPFHL